MDGQEIILNHKIDEGKKIYDVTNMIYDIFETYQVSQVIALHILQRM